MTAQRTSMSDRPVRLGFIYPGGGAEPDYYRFAEAVEDRVRVFLVGSRIPAGDDHSIPALLETARVEHIVEAARRLVPLRPDAVMWACTSGSFVVGRRGAEAQVEAITAATKAPAGSTSLAFVHALSALGRRRVAVLATYPEPASRAFAGFLAEWGVDVRGLEWLDAASGWDAAGIPPEKVVEAARAADAREAEVLLLPDTALPTLAFIEELERTLGKPVLTANQVTLWDGLRLAGASLRVAGYGRLLNREDGR